MIIIQPNNSATFSSILGCLIKEVPTRMALAPQASSRSTSCRVSIPLSATRILSGVFAPVIYLARTFQTDIDTVVKFFIFVLIFVFDPMAVMFVISYNVALENRDEEEAEKLYVNEKKKRWWEVYGEKKKEDTPMYTEEHEQRMDIIGQNGNDGIHYEEDEKPKPTDDIGRGGFRRKQ